MQGITEIPVGFGSSVRVEPLFGEAKEFHRLRRLFKVNIEGVMVAAGQKPEKIDQAGSRFAFFLFSPIQLLAEGL